MKKRIVFAGGKPLGIRILKHLLGRDDIDLVGVFENTEDWSPPHWYGDETVSSIASANRLRPHGFMYAELLASLKPDLLVVAYYDTIIRPDCFSIPPMGAINIHMADAERYRGCYPTTHAIMNGEDETAVTIHYIDKGMDSGNILGRRFTDIRPYDTGYSLYMRLVDDAVALFEQVLPLLLKDELGSKKQVAHENIHIYHRKDFPSHEVQLIGRTGSQIYNNIRALIFPGFPMPYIKIGEKKYELMEVK